MLYLKSKTRFICLSTFFVVLLSACGGGDETSNDNDIQTLVITENDDNVISEDSSPVVVTPEPSSELDTDTSDPAVTVNESTIIENTNEGHRISALSEAEIINYLTLINNARSVARTCNGTGSFPAVAPVAWSDKLYKAAYEHSQDLAESDTFSHDGSGTVSDWSGFALNKKSSMTDRVATYHYNWSWISENISAGTTRDNPQQAVDSWLASSGHCHNIMSPNVTEVGMAVSANNNSKFTYYWTQNFGNPR